MFSLIITIVSIVLVVALVAATLYHGGDTINKGKHEAEIAKSLNELSQIKGALTAYRVETGMDATSIDVLVPKYLSGVPQGWGVDVADAPVAFESSRLLVGSEPEKLNSCKEINKRLGLGEAEPPACSTIDANFTGCCISTAP